jgi:hypothetical protein
MAATIHEEASVPECRPFWMYGSAWPMMPVS